MYNDIMQWVSKSLPTITKKAIDELVVKSQKHDKCSFNFLLKYYEPCIYQYIIIHQKIKNTHIWFDDMMQIGLSALEEAIKCWDKEREAKFNGFFWLILSRRFSSFISRRGYHIRVYDDARKRGCKNPQMVSYDYITTDTRDESHRFSLLNHLCYENTLDDYIWQDFLEEVKVLAKKKLTKKQYKIFQGWYIDGENFQTLKDKTSGIDNLLYGKQNYKLDALWEACRGLV